MNNPTTLARAIIDPGLLRDLWRRTWFITVPVIFIASALGEIVLLRGGQHLTGPPNVWLFAGCGWLFIMANVCINGVANRPVARRALRQLPIPGPVVSRTLFFYYTSFPALLAGILIFIALPFVCLLFFEPAFHPLWLAISLALWASCLSVYYVLPALLKVSPQTLSPASPESKSPRTWAFVFIASLYLLAHGWTRLGGRSMLSIADDAIHTNALAAMLALFCELVVCVSAFILAPRYMQVMPSAKHIIPIRAAARGSKFYLTQAQRQFRFGFILAAGVIALFKLLDLGSSGTRSEFDWLLNGPSGHDWIFVNNMLVPLAFSGLSLLQLNAARVMRSLPTRSRSLAIFNFKILFARVLGFYIPFALLAIFTGNAGLLGSLPASIFALTSLMVFIGFSRQYFQANITLGNVLLLIIAILLSIFVLFLPHADRGVNTLGFTNTQLLGLTASLICFAFAWKLLITQITKNQYLYRRAISASGNAPRRV